MREKNHRDDSPSPLQLLAGCATFPFSLVYSAWKANENDEPVVKHRNKKNTRLRQYDRDHDLQYRRRHHVAARRKATDPNKQSRRTHVVKQRGGKEDYEDVHSREKSRQRSEEPRPVRTSTPVKDRNKNAYTRDATPCCSVAEGVTEVYPDISQRRDPQVNSSSFNKNSMCRDCIDKYEKGIQMNYVRNLTILWFPPNFSQSRFGDRSAGSNACTLICILVSYKCHKTSLKLPNIRMQEAWEPLMNILAESIVEGNSIHERLRKDKILVEDNLTVPEAINATRNHVQKVTEWESDIVTARMKTSLFDFLSNKVMHWYSIDLSQNGSDLYVVVISLSRSVVLIFQRDSETVTLVDSHSHYPHGAAVAQVPFKKLRELCNWYACMLNDSAKKPIVQYELSYLYFS